MSALAVKPEKYTFPSACKRPVLVLHYRPSIIRVSVQCELLAKLSLDWLFTMQLPRFFTIFILPFLLPLIACADDWPQWMGPQRDGVWRESGLIQTFPESGPTFLWKQPVGGGYSGPAVVGNSVFLTDRILPTGIKDPDNPFQKSSSGGFERVICFDAATGKPKWTHQYPVTYSIQYPCGPRATPLFSDGNLYTLGAMGHLLCLNAKDGKPVWKRDFTSEFGAPVPIWGFSAHPLLVGNALITLVGGKDGSSVAMAFHKSTGEVLWKSLSLKSPQSEIGYCPPTLINSHGKSIVIIWHSEAVCALEPDSGKVLWEVPFKLKANLSVPTPKLSGDNLLVSSFYNGSMLLRLNPNGNIPAIVWKGQGRGETPKQTDGLHSIMATPMIDGDYFYGVCSYGELRCLRMRDGVRVWENLTATGSAREPVERWANAFLIRQDKRTILFNEKGDLIIAQLSPTAYQEISRAHLLNPTGIAPGGGASRKIVWSHPAFARKCVFARNDKELVCVSMASQQQK